MAKLSPTAQWISAMANRLGTNDGNAAGILRVAAAHLLKENGWSFGVRWSAEELQSIARELEGQP
jgi:hypothetical protein